MDKNENPSLYKYEIKPTMKPNIKNLKHNLLLLPLSSMLFIMIFISCDTEPKYSNSIEMYSTVNLNIRKGPGTEFEILKTVEPNTNLLAYDSITKGFIMLLNRDNTKFGWAAEKYLQTSPLSESQLALLNKKEEVIEQPNHKGTSSVNQKSEHSLGHKLAVVETGKYYTESDLKVKRFNNLLDQLSNKYVENQQEIADITVKAKNILNKNGIDESMEKIMEGMNLIFSLEHENMNYSEYAASYVIMRTKGRSHKESIENLTALLQSLGIY